MQIFLRFPKWKTKAVTLSYDDGTIYDDKLIEIMSRYGVKGTFNINAGMMSEKFFLRQNAEVLNNLYKSFGMEIAMHGYNHEYLTGCKGSDILKEYLDDKLYLEKYFDIVIRGGAYAFGVCNDEIVNTLKMLGVSYFRTTQDTNSFALPTDFMRINPTIKHTANNLFELLDRFILEDPNKSYRAEPLLFYLWGHSYEFENNGNWNVIEKFCEKISKTDNIWCATNSEIYDYCRQIR